jgi:hypothetical protein
VLYPLIVKCREHDVDRRMYLRDVFLRVGKVSDVRELTPYGWKRRWAPLALAHRAGSVERLLRKVDG